MSVFPTMQNSIQLFWTLIEVYVDNNGNKIAVSPLIYDSYDLCVAQYFQVGAAAARSSNVYHAVAILQSDGRITDSRVFDRRVANG